MNTLFWHPLHISSVDCELSKKTCSPSGHSHFLPCTFCSFPTGKWNWRGLEEIEFAEVDSAKWLFMDDLCLLGGNSRRSYRSWQNVWSHFIPIRIINHGLCGFLQSRQWWTRNPKAWVWALPVNIYMYASIGLCTAVDVVSLLFYPPYEDFQILKGMWNWHNTTFSSFSVSTLVEI